MPSFLSAHVITCMTRQDLNRLLMRLLQESQAGKGDVRLTRVRTDTISGRMVCEWEAPDQDTLVAWLEQRNIRFRSNEEWVMCVQMESRDGKMVSL